jgi:predicted DNA-binding protein
MPKEKKMSSQRTILSMPHELKERIRKFRFANEIDTEAEAIRLLIERGLEASEEQSSKGKGRKQRQPELAKQENSD